MLMIVKLGSKGKFQTIRKVNLGLASIPLSNSVDTGEVEGGKKY